MTQPAARKPGKHDAALTAACAEGMTPGEAAAALGITPSYASLRGRQIGLKFREGRGRNMLALNAAEKYRNLAEQGYSQATTAKILGVSREAVRLMANRHGIEFDSGMVDVDFQERVEALHGEGKSAPEIAAATGRTQQSAMAALRRLGLTPHKAQRPCPLADKVRTLAAQGMTVSEIARHLGIAPSNVSAAKARHGIEFIADGRAKRFAALPTPTAQEPAA